MNSTVQFLLSLTIAIAAVIGVIKYRKMNPDYHPLVYSAILATIFEIAFEFIKYEYHPRIYMIMGIVYPLLDFLLLAWLFHNWGLFNRNKKLFGIILGAFFTAWAVSAYLSIITKLSEAIYFFIFLYSAALILFSVNTFNRFVVQERVNIFKNPKFWICIGVIIFYTFFILTTIPLLPGFHGSFSKRFQEMRFYINALVNLIYAIAVLWIPRKKPITTLS
jgi:magnesium-transporting ATPase (P-type)